MLKIKKVILFILDSIKKLLFLNNLNKNELNGFITPLTKFRLFPNTRVTVPYSLGRTVRGVSFDKNLKFDAAGRLSNDISTGLDDKKIANSLSTVIYEQKNMSAADIVNLSNNITLKKYPAWALVMPWE